MILGDTWMYWWMERTAFNVRSLHAKMGAGKNGPGKNGPGKKGPGKNGPR